MFQETIRESCPTKRLSTTKEVGWLVIEYLFLALLKCTIIWKNKSYENTYKYFLWSKRNIFSKTELLPWYIFLLLVVRCPSICPSVRLPVNCSQSSFSRTTGQISTKLGKKHPWVKRIQAFSNEGSCTLPRGDYCEIVKIHLLFVCLFVWS